MIDFTTWRQMTVRALHAEPLYRVEDVLPVQIHRSLR
jgi:hypothetical protein